MEGVAEIFGENRFVIEYPVVFIYQGHIAGQQAHNPPEALAFLVAASASQRPRYFFSLGALS